MDGRNKFNDTHYNFHADEPNENSVSESCVIFVTIPPTNYGHKKNATEKILRLSKKKTGMAKSYRLGKITLHESFFSQNIFNTEPSLHALTSCQQLRALIPVSFVSELNASPLCYPQVRIKAFAENKCKVKFRFSKIYFSKIAKV